MTTTLFDAMDAVRDLCGANRHLVEDPIINELVEFAANGRHAPAFDEVVGGFREPTVRILPANPNAPARYPHEPAAPVGSSCRRCGVRFGPKAVRSPVPDHWDDGLEGRDGSRHTCWVPAGSAAIELVMCRVCRDYLDADYGVEWR